MRLQPLLYLCVIPESNCDLFTSEQNGTDYVCFSGTLGQPKIWDITNPVSYQYPMAPYDVLVDPQTLPTLPKGQTDPEPTAQETKHTDQSNEVCSRVEPFGRFCVVFYLAMLSCSGEIPWFTSKTVKQKQNKKTAVPF